MLTAVPARRLAEFEYHGHPLSPDERHSLATLFGISDHALEGGFVARHVAQPTLTQAQAKALAALAAVAALAWSLRLGPPVSISGSSRPAMAALGTEAQLPVPRFNLSVDASETSTATATPEPTTTHEPTPTWEPTATATAEPSPTTVPTVAQEPIATFQATAEPLPTATTTIIPTPEPTEASLASAPTATRRPVRGFRLVKQPTPAPRRAAARDGKSKPVQPLPAHNLSDETHPSRCPVVPARGRVVLTQGYGVGSHVPSDLWGGVDLAVGGAATHGATVVATHSGYVQVTLDSWPGGNFVSVVSDTGWRTGYAHLDTVVVNSGEYVQAGTPIGTVGSTVSVTGPHLHYETWYQGVNVDPSSSLSCR